MTNHDMHIGLDMDGVLMDHTEWKQILARNFGYTLTAAETTSDAMKRLVPDEHRLQIQQLIYSDDRYALGPALMDGARELLTSLRDAGVPFTLISRRHNPDLARLLLAKHRLRPEFLTDANTLFVGSIQDKADACARLGVTHYLDDEVGVLNTLASVPNRYLFDPHGVSAHVPYPRVSTLAQFRDTILKP